MRLAENKVVPRMVGQAAVLTDIAGMRRRELLASAVTPIKVNREKGIGWRDKGLPCRQSSAKMPYRPKNNPALRPVSRPIRELLLVIVAVALKLVRATPMKMITMRKSW